MVREPEVWGSKASPARWTRIMDNPSQIQISLSENQSHSFSAPCCLVEAMQRNKVQSDEVLMVPYFINSRSTSKDSRTTNNQTWFRGHLYKTDLVPLFWCNSRSGPSVASQLGSSRHPFWWCLSQSEAEAGTDGPMRGCHLPYIWGC